jgi:DNA-binding transcriptional regulator LsrR (DeoR family)
MARLRRDASPGLAEGGSLRLRAAWLYYSEGLTQKDIAERLGLSRTTIVRMLEEARKRGEVRIWIDESVSECIELSIALENKLPIDEAIVVPAAPGADATARSVGLALGEFLSGISLDHATIGVGWGRTLTASLASFRPARREAARVVSLLGGIVEARSANPVEFAWRLAGQLGAECYMFPAPLIVDSAETRRRLIEECGLDRLYALAGALDLAILSVGEVAMDTTSLAGELIPPEDLAQIIALGGVADLMCNFLDAQGRTINHPVSERVMSVTLESVRAARHVVIASGGAQRAAAIRAVIRRVGCNTLITDESAARALVAL